MQQGLIRGHSQHPPQVKKSQRQNKIVGHSRPLKTLFNVLVSFFNCCPVLHMGLLGTLFISLDIFLGCLRDLGGLEKGGIQGAVGAQFGGNTRVDQALCVRPNPFLGDRVAWLACN